MIFLSPATWRGIPLRLSDVVQFASKLWDSARGELKTSLCWGNLRPAEGVPWAVKPSVKPWVSSISGQENLSNTLGIPLGLAGFLWLSLNFLPFWFRFSDTWGLTNGFAAVKEPIWTWSSKDMLVAKLRERLKSPGTTGEELIRHGAGNGMWWAWDILGSPVTLHGKKSEEAPQPRVAQLPVTPVGPGGCAFDPGEIWLGDAHVGSALGATHEVSSG